AAATAALFIVVPQEGLAQSRYASPPPVMVSPDMAAPWVMQLQRAPTGRPQARPVERRTMPQGVVVPAAGAPVRPRSAIAPRQPQRPAVQLATAAAPRPAIPQLDPKWLPQTVDYDGSHKAGTVVIDTDARFLYLVQKDGK